MKRNHLAFICALALCFAMTGCSKGDKPNVTPTPSMAPTSPVGPTQVPGPVQTPGTAPTTTPEETTAPTDNYNADGDGQVENSDNGGDLKEGATGRKIRSAVDEAGNVIGGAVRGTGRAIRDVGEDLTGRR